jgi:hypothetical protein
MKSKTQLRKFLAVICMMAAGTASAAITGYVSNPTANSTDWGNAVTSLGATIDTGVNFNSIAGTGTVTPAIGAFYAPTTGVTFSASNVTLAASMLSNGYGTPASSGEGVWTPSKLLVASSASLSATPAQSVTFSFQQGVYGGGVFLVDYFGDQPWTITARDSSNNVLGSYQSITGLRFQQNNIDGAGKTHKYFLGIASTEANIASLMISRASISMYQSGDRVGLDDFRFAVAAVPEPAEWAMVLTGLFVVGFIARRRKGTFR